MSPAKKETATKEAAPTETKAKKTGLDAGDTIGEFSVVEARDGYYEVQRILEDGTRIAFSSTDPDKLKVTAESYDADVAARKPPEELEPVVFPTPPGEPEPGTAEAEEEEVTA